MSAPAGWYPDPAGEPDLYRYWDGLNWSATTSPVPNAPLPHASTQNPSELGSDQSAPNRTAGAAPYRTSGAAPPKRSQARWLLPGIVLVAVIAVVITWTVLLRDQDAGVRTPPPAASPADTCPTAGVPTATPAEQSGAAVTSGKLSYPQLGEPWSVPTWDRRVPFGRDVQHQQATVEADGSGSPTWVASVLIVRLLAGDGFYGPQQGAALVAKCVTGLFYGTAVVTRQDRKNQAITLDGHNAWLIESHLSFDLRPDGIQTRGELLIVVVVDTGDGEAGLFYASVPDTSPQFEAPARASLAALTVTG